MLTRSVLIFLLALFTSVMFFPYFIRYMKGLNLHQEVSEYALEDFKKKEDTPTMGGVMIVLVTLLSLLVVSPKSYLSFEVWLVLFPFLLNATIGFIDDYLILIKKDNEGLPAKVRFGSELLIGVIFFFVFKQVGGSNALKVPWTPWVLHSSLLFFIVVVVMQAGVNNAVNLTDGMDGLAGGTVLLALIPYLVAAYHQELYDLVYLTLALMGALLGYLFYNVKPARVFMGDVGSLPLGAFLASMAIVVKEELSLLIVGFIFVSNVVSVILQVWSVKTRGKRIFKYTPLHYSFKISGYKEKRIVQGYWMLGFILMLLGLSIVM